jgi:hypothetical protein
VDASRRLPDHVHAVDVERTQAGQVPLLGHAHLGGNGVEDHVANSLRMRPTVAPTCGSSSVGECSSSRLRLVLYGMPDDRVTRIAALLHEAAETHHTVYRITDGDDPDWASWYADWLLELSELSDLLGAKPVRSHLVHALVQLDRDYTAKARDESWEDWYSRGLIGSFAL